LFVRLNDSSLKLESLSFALECLSLRLDNSSLRLVSLTLKLQCLSLRLDDSSLKLQYWSLRLDDSSLKLQYWSLRLDDLSLKLQCLSLKLDDSSFKLNSSSLTNKCCLRALFNTFILINNPSLYYSALRQGSGSLFYIMPTRKYQVPNSRKGSPWGLRLEIWDLELSCRY
jgi:hypothetical protein